MRGWPLWELRPGLVVALLAVELTAVVLVSAALATTESAGVMSGTDWWHLWVVVGLGIAHLEAVRGVERTRDRLSVELHINIGSVWSFAAVILLPPAWAAVGAVTVHTWTWFRSSRPRRPPFKQAFNVATLALVVLASGAVFGLVLGGDAVTGVGSDGLAAALTDPSGVAAVLVAALVYFTVSTALVGGVIAVHSPELKAADIVGDWQENLLEFATYCLGTLTALALLVNPWLVLFVLPTVLVLHRAVLVRHLEEAASRDSKTGLLNAAAWHNVAERELRRAERRETPRGVLVIDLDHFKQVNDTYGHLAGDHVLAAVASAVSGEVRDRDVVGRFGGEEFVVLVGGVGDTAEVDTVARVEAVAERIRARVATLRVEIPTPDGPLTIAGLTTSVGGALYPPDGRDLRTLMHVADTALYAAKRAGRNAVRTGRHELPPVPFATEPRSAEPAGTPPSADR